MKRLAVTGCALILTACAATPSITSVSDPSTGYKAINAKSAMDTAGGPRLLVVTDGTGRVVALEVPLRWLTGGSRETVRLLETIRDLALLGYPYDSPHRGGAPVLRAFGQIVEIADKALAQYEPPITPAPSEDKR